MIDVSMISLQSKLKQEPHVLGQVASTWSIYEEGQNDAATIHTLLERVQNAHAARSVWEALSGEERLCLFHLLGSGNPARQKGVTLEQLRRKTKLSPATLDAALERLAHQWYLVEVGMISGPSAAGVPKPAQRGASPFRECFGQLWHTGQELFKSYADRSAYSLQHLISTFSGEQLRHLAQLCHVQSSSSGPIFSFAPSPSMSHPIEVHKRLYAALCHPLMPFDLLHRLEPMAQELFLWLCEEGGKVPMPEVRSRVAAPRRFLACLDALEAHALAFDSFSCEGERWLFIPQDFLTIVQQEAQQQREDERCYALCPLVEALEPQEGLPLLLYDLASVIGMSLQNVLEPTKDDKLPKRWRDKIRPLLHGRARLGEGESDLYVDQLFHTARALEVLRCGAPPGEEKRRYLPGPKLSLWSERTLASQAQQFMTWWAKTGSCWQDIHPNGRPMCSSSTTRKVLLAFLTQCVPGRWYRRDALLYWIWRQMPLSLYDAYHHTLTKPTPLRVRREQWMEREGGEYVGLLASTLTELGVIALLDSAHDGRRATDAGPQLFCVTAFGGAILTSVTDQPAVLPPAVLHKPLLLVQPNYDVLLMQFVPSLVYQLLSFAQIQRMGVVSEFRLTQQALLQGMAAGITVQQVEALLIEQSGQGELPQNVAYTLQDWVKAYKEARLEEIILIELPPAQAEDTLYRALSPITPRKLAPGVFVVASGKNAFVDLRRRLAKAGIVVREQRPGG